MREGAATMGARSDAGLKSSVVHDFEGPKN